MTKGKNATLGRHRRKLFLSNSRDGTIIGGLSPRRIRGGSAADPPRTKSADYSPHVTSARQIGARTLIARNDYCVLGWVFRVYMVHGSIISSSERLLLSGNGSGPKSPF